MTDPSTIYGLVYNLCYDLMEIIKYIFTVSLSVTLTNWFIIVLIYFSFYFTKQWLSCEKQHIDGEYIDKDCIPVDL